MARIPGHISGKGDGPGGVGVVVGFSSQQRQGQSPFFKGQCMANCQAEADLGRRRLKWIQMARGWAERCLLMEQKTLSIWELS